MKIFSKSNICHYIISHILNVLNYISSAKSAPQHKTKHPKKINQFANTVEKLSAHSFDPNGAAKKRRRVLQMGKFEQSHITWIFV
jgi:lipopolysaccharide export system protein LptC